ncbi:MAG: MFS transporter [Pseudomonadota bacterium]
MAVSHWILLFSLYVTQFLPIAFFAVALPVILRENGASLHDISLFYILGLVWVVKFIWAPLIDRVRFGRFGHYRIWLLITQSLLVVLVCVAAFVVDPSDLGLLLLFGSASAVVASTQDIAADAVGCRLLPRDMHGLGGSVQLCGGLVGTILGGGGVLIIYGWAGWQASALLVAAALAPVIIQILLFDDRIIGDSDGRKETVPFTRLISFWVGRDRLALAMILMFLPLSVTMASALSAPRLVDRGWASDDVGLLLHVAAPLCVIPFSFLVGFVLVKTSKWFVLGTMPFLQVGAIFAALAFAGPSSADIQSGIILSILYGAELLVFSVLLTFMLGATGLGTEGTDFTIQNSVYGAVAFAGAAIALNFAEAIGYDAMLIACLVMSTVIGLGVLVYALSKRRGETEMVNP